MMKRVPSHMNLKSRLARDRNVYRQPYRAASWARSRPDRGSKPEAEPGLRSDGPGAKASGIDVGSGFIG